MAKSVFDATRIYEEDAGLLRFLGIEVPSELPHGKRAYLGKTTVYGSEVKVWVTAFPAQFFDFEIERDDKRFILTTGSGTLSKYWQTVVMFASGLLDVKVEPK